MSQRFIKGYTNNHLTWVMVDATDFATPESALSAAMKIKIYGKVKGATGVNFVSSGTGSLTNDIQHVGASALGIYTIALANADLSDASQAWYDQYIVSLSATGAAYQTLVVDGGIMESYLSNLLSDVGSDVIVMSGILSDTYSAVVATQSMASDAASAAQQGNSRVLLVQSRLSDLNSTLNSDISDIRSMLTALSDAISDAHSDLGSKIGGITATLSASDMSDLRSAIAAGPAATITASDISDIASAVWAHTIGARVDSRILVAQSYLSDIRSDVSDMHSDLLVMSGILSDAYSLLGVINSDVSDLTSRITGAVATASDVASKVWAEKYTASSNVKASTFGSLFRLAGSRVSDIQSQITAGVSLDASTMSDLRSAVSAGAAGAVTVSDISDIASRVYAVLASDLSDILSAAQQTNSRALVIQSHASNIYSMVSDLQSDFQSRVPKLVATNSQVSDLASDLRSQAAIGAGNSAILSDIYSLLSDLSSDVGVMSGIVSDIASAVLSAGVKKNTALNNFTFLLVSSSDHITPATGLTVAATRSIDGGAFAACTNSGTIAEVGNGVYGINFSAADLNGNVIMVRFTATGADDRYITLKTQP